MNQQLLDIWPKKILGKWSLGLAIAMPILFIIGSSFTNSLYASVPSGNTLLADIDARPALALTMLAGMLTGIAAGITGFLSIIRQKERGMLVYLSTALGTLLVIFLIAEILFPH